MNVSSRAEFIPTSALKFSLKILVPLTSRDTIDNIYPSRKHPKNLCDIFGIRFGVNSHKQGNDPTESDLRRFAP